MPPTAMDTRLRGYDSHLVMPDSIGHPFLHCHPRLDRGAMPSTAVDTRVRGYDKRRATMTSRPGRLPQSGKVNADYAQTRSQSA